MLLRDLKPGDVAKIAIPGTPIVMRTWRNLDDNTELNNSYLVRLDGIDAGGTWSGRFFIEHQEIEVLKLYKLNIPKD